MPPPVPQAPHPPFAPAGPPPQTGYAPQPGYPPPGYPAPPVYAPPPGAYAAGPAGYQQIGGPYTPPAPGAPASSAIGVWALVLALIALIVPSVMAWVTGFAIGAGIGESDLLMLGESDPDSLAFLAPVRDQVLWAEIAFWGGTVLGLWALVQGIVAIARRRGRGQGIGAVVLAVVASGSYWIVLFVALTAGATTSAISLYG